MARLAGVRRLPAYVWEIAGRSPSIILSLDVVDAIESAVQQGFKAVPKRGLEVGGLLLGTCQPSLPGTASPLKISIEGFEIIPSEHKRGPSYTLSFKDKDEFISRISQKRNLDVIGYWRSHTRPGLYLDEDDASVIDQFFAAPEKVILLIRPSESGVTAGFFCWESGALDRRSSGLEFPFHRGALVSGGHQILEPEPQPESVPAPETSVPQPVSQEILEAPALPTPPRKPWRRGLVRVPIAAAVLAGAILFYWYNSRPRVPADSGQSQEISAALLLNVDRIGNQLRLSWDRSSPAVRDARRGTLWIVDGGRRQELELDSGQLQYGSFAYWPTSRDVNFQLEVVGVLGAVSESVRTLVGAPTEPGPFAGSDETASAQISGSGSVEAAKNARKPSPVGPRQRQENPRTFSAHVGANRVDPPRIEPPPLLSATALPASSPPPIPHRAQSSLPRRPEAVVSYEPVRVSPLRRAFAKIPGLGLLARRRQHPDANFLPARPVHQVKPLAPPEVALQLDHEVPVKLKVYIDETGRVEKAEFLSGEERDQLSRVARTAAHLWRFAPARLDDHPVPSEMVLNFVFGTPN
ncbi:MAG: hypothetical protein FJW37_00170 [Acidobacteria bacterium]|nr:hypothetical protein [Acidobacteriota bacterium]